MFYVRLLAMMALLAVLYMIEIRLDSSNAAKKTKWKKRKQRNERIKEEFLGYCFCYREKIDLFHDHYGNFWIGDEKLTSDVFRKELETECGKDIRKYRDIKGNPVISLWVSIPTFDSYDRQWDSYRSFYIVQYKKHLTGIFFQGGYRLVKAALYTDLRSGDEKTKKMLKTMGMADGKAFGKYRMPDYS